MTGRRQSVAARPPARQATSASITRAIVHSARTRFHVPTFLSAQLPAVSSRAESEQSRRSQSPVSAPELAIA